MCIIHIQKKLININYYYLICNKSYTQFKLLYFYKMIIFIISTCVIQNCIISFIIKNQLKTNYNISLLMQYSVSIVYNYNVINLIENNCLL